MRSKKHANVGCDLKIFLGIHSNLSFEVQNQATCYVLFLTLLDLSFQFFKVLLDNILVFHWLAVSSFLTAFSVDLLFCRTRESRRKPVHVLQTVELSKLSTMQDAPLSECWQAIQGNLHIRSNEAAQRIQIYSNFIRFQFEFFPHLVPKNLGQGNLA